jgi:hypothetical protein
MSRRHRARLTFSDAIGSSPWFWRCSSFAIAAAISGSVSVSVPSFDYS